MSQGTELEIVEGVMAGRVRARATSLKSLSPPACTGERKLDLGKSFLMGRLGRCLWKGPES